MTREHVYELGCFDIETTGTNVETDRIVSAAFVILSPDGAVKHEQSWLLNPEIEIPSAATAVHGISTARAVQYGTAAPAAIREIATALVDAQLNGQALVAFNAPFDFTILDRECRRHLGIPLATRAEVVRPVIDPYVIDKALDKFRPGKRTLAAVSEHYGVPLNFAHTAIADAVAAGRLALAMLEHSRLQYVEIPDLHTSQIAWKRDQSESLAAFHSEQQGQRVEYPTAWPLIPKD